MGAVSRDVLAERFRAQLLGGDRATDAVGVCERLLAVQAQDLRSARLAVRARTEGLAASDVDRQLDAGDVVVGWLNRGTLQLVRREDYRWLHALTTPPLFTGNARRLVQMGVSPDAADRGVAAIERALGDDGPLTRDELRERVDAVRVPTAGQALVHLLMLACLRGICLRGPLVRGRHAYVLTRDWIGGNRPPDRAQSLAELARRYLAGHAPASDRDLAKWSGLPLRDARAGLAELGASLVQRDDGRLELRGSRRGGEPRTCLLDQWDPLLVGWQSRDLLLAAYPRLESPDAHYRPFAYAAGRAVAVWHLRRGHVELEPFTRLTAQERRAVDADSADVVRFLA
jgi:hypothetical protein